MTAPELLAQVEARGGSVAVARDATGAAMLKITPRGLVPDLLPELAKFKPALLELLAPTGAPSPPGASERAQSAAAGTCGPDVPNGANFGSICPDDAEARRLLRPEIRRVFCDADVIAIGRLLFKLDAGEEIE